MTTPRKRSGLLRWGLRLGLLSVIVVCGVVAWRYWRPAMGIEQQVVGTWRASYSDTRHKGQWIFTLTEARLQVIDGEVFGGKWYMEGNRIHFLDPWYEEAARTLLRSNSDDALELTFEGEDIVTAHSLLNGLTFRWERLPD